MLAASPLRDANWTQKTLSALFNAMAAGQDWPGDPRKIGHDPGKSWQILGVKYIFEIIIRVNPFLCV